MSIARRLDIEAEAAKALLANLRDVLAGDDDLAADMIEGETGLMEAADAALARIQELDAFEAAIKAQIDDLKARKDRFARQAEMIRAALGSAMGMADLKKIERPSGTISLRAVPPSALIVNEAEIPSEYWMRQDPKLDKRALLSALKDGPVPGATLNNGGQSVSIRSK